MPTFKQKNVIKSYKLRLQEKLKTVTEETENATAFLNNCVAEVNKYNMKKLYWMNIIIFKLLSNIGDKICLVFYLAWHTIKI